MLLTSTWVDFYKTLKKMISFNKLAVLAVFLKNTSGTKHKSNDVFDNLKQSPPTNPPASVNASTQGILSSNNATKAVEKVNDDFDFEDAIQQGAS